MDPARCGARLLSTTTHDGTHYNQGRWAVRDGRPCANLRTATTEGAVHQGIQEQTEAAARNGLSNARGWQLVLMVSDFAACGFVCSSAFTAASPRAVLSSRQAIEGRVNAELRTAVPRIVALIVESVLSLGAARNRFE